MNTKQIIFEIQKRFEEALQAKTNWGRNEIKSIYDKVLIDVLSEQI